VDFTHVRNGPYQTTLVRITGDDQRSVVVTNQKRRPRIDANSSFLFLGTVAFQTIRLQQYANFVLEKGSFFLDLVADVRRLRVARCLWRSGQLASYGDQHGGRKRYHKFGRAPEVRLSFAFNAVHGTMPSSVKDHTAWMSKCGGRQ
jgi:hypothetical protein